VTGATLTSSGFPGTSGSSIASTNGAYQSTYGGGGQDAFVTKLNPNGTGLVYSTYLGGSGIDQGYGIAVNQAGQAYVSGQSNTPGSGFPGTAGSSILSTNAGDYDAFVTKLNEAGTALVFSTYLGGSSIDNATGIALDQAGNAYVTGTTNTMSGFPGITASSIQSTYAGGERDGFVAKITTNVPFAAFAAKAEI
jgi:hypothetical protein